MKIEELENKVDLLSLFEDNYKTKKVGGNLYRVNPCPVCGKKEHFTIYPKTNSYSSFNGCCEGGSIYKYLIEIEGMNEDDAYKKLIDLSGEEKPQTSQNKVNNTISPLKNKKALKPNIEPSINNYINKCNRNVDKTDYFIKRGFTKETIDNFKLGYDENKKAAIIPVTENYYFSRSIEGKNFYNPEGVNIELFNIDKLKGNKPIFIVESMTDALSIIQLGGQSISLNGAGNYKTLVSELKKTSNKPLLILSLDNDKTGKEKTELLSNELDKLNIIYSIENISNESNDVNEALIRDKGILRAEIKAAEVRIKEIRDKKENEIKEEYYKNNALNYIENFKNGINASIDTPPVATGFNQLDKLLEGGLYEGLYIIGAISSLGKTTMTLQIADQIAQNQKDVLIFSLEMARSELMAKSISRLTLLNTDDTRKAKTTRGITTGKRYLKYSKDEKTLINKSIEDYSSYANNIFISEGLGNIGVTEIRAAVKKHIDITGNKPIIVIDYLQILKSENDRVTDKQAMDITVMELKRISRDYKIPVIGISGFSRNFYSKEVSMASFKESGAIEYSSDVLIGLQYKGQGNSDFNLEDAANKNPRDIELKILKNRNGGRGKTTFQYYPLFNYFKEIETYNKNKVAKRI